MAISRLSIIKFFELALAVACITLHSWSVMTDFIQAVSAAVFGGYIIILIGSFVGYMMSTPINRRIDIFYCLVGCATFAAVAALNLNHLRKLVSSSWHNCGFVKSSLAIINSALFLIDSLLTYYYDY